RGLSPCGIGILPMNSSLTGWKPVPPLNRWKHLLNFGAMRLVLHRQPQAFAKLFDRLVDGESRSIRCDFEKNSACLAEINRVKILPIDDGGDAEPKINKFVAPAQLFFFVGGAKSNVMDRSRGDVAESAGSFNQI